MTKHIFNLLGLISIALAVLGAFLPLLPTTPFVLLAGFCFSRGSERLHLWLHQQKTFGPIILEWENGGIIKRKPKLIATALIILAGVHSSVMASFWIAAVVCLILACVIIFIWSRPEK